MARAKGEGSIYQRDDGLWVSAIWVGKRKLVKYSNSKAEAADKLAQLRAQQLTGSVAMPSRMTLAQWVDQWLALLEPDLRPSTLATYRKTVQYVVRLLPDVRLDKLTPIMLTRAFAQLQKTTNAQRQLNLAHGYLTACLQRAVELDLLTTNPMTKVKKPKWEPDQRQYWSISQVQAFLSTARTSSHRYAPLFLLLCTAGMRVSEALALTWDDIDENTVTINKALVWHGKTWSIQQPKTKAGYRTLGIPASVRQALQPGTGYVFWTKNDTPPRLQHLRIYLKELCEAAQVPVINIHGLRHVHAMLSIEATQDAYAVQRRLGHSNIRVTLGIYGYSKREDADLVDKLNALLG